MATPVSGAEDVLLDCRSVWKIFGKQAPAAMKAVQERGLGKREVLQEFGCVVGVSDATLQVRRGEIFCVMGLSGSGKSTLIRMLNRLIDPTSGEIFVKGKALSQLGAAELRAMRAKHIGMVFQSVALLPNRTVLENAAFGLEVQRVPKAERNAAAEASLRKVGLGDWMQRYPRELSGGMQQRVGLARALTADPEIILMDEPFSALDPLIRRQLQDEFRELTKSLGKSAVFITHDLDEAIRIGDRIAIMKDGVIIQVGTAEEIILNPADAYVAEFVAGISRLHLIKAHSIMVPVAEFRSGHPSADLTALPSTGPGADIDHLIDLTLAHPGPGIAVLDGGAPVGIVTPTSLLLGVKSSTSESHRLAGAGVGAGMDTSVIADTFDAWVDEALIWVSDNGAFLFDWVRAVFEGFYDGVLAVLQIAPWFVVAIVFGLLGWRVVGRSFGALTGAGLAACWLMGLWPETTSTFALVISATFLALVLALPIGVLAGFLPRLDRFIEPILDLIQTLPPYIYLLPAIALLGFGPATALAATLIVAMPPAIRLTSLGIRQTPVQFVELGQSTGMTPWQMFWKIRLPFALPSIMAGINQSLMMAFGMVVIAGIVGSGGLGEAIYGAIRTLDIGKSIDAAIAIVILTIVIDRLTQNLVRTGRDAA